MNSKLVFILALWLIQSFSLAAQSIVSGIITDKENMPMQSATIVLLKGVDSTFITGTVSNADGRYEIANIKPDNYILSYSMIGYKKVDIPHHVEAGKNYELSEIVLEEDTYMLSGVTITGKRPPVKIEPGKMTINLSSALLTTTGNVLDALRKLPGVMVQDDGTIVLNGKSGANVLIDDKLTYLSGENLINYLRSLPAESVDNIELISQPSSKYDAAGSSGIINIQKKRIKEQGINIAASSSLESGKYQKLNENLSLSLRHNKLNVYADYSYNWGKDYYIIEGSGKYLDAETGGPLDLRKDFLNDTKRHSNAHYVKAGLDYDFSDKLTAGTYFSANWVNRKKSEQNLSDFFIRDGLVSDSTLNAAGKYDYGYTNLTGGANVVYRFTDRGRWDASFDYQLFDQDNDQLMQSQFETHIRPIEKDTMSGNTGGDIKIYSGQTNFTYNLSEKIRIGAGLKTAFVNIGSNALYKNLHNGKWLEDASLSSSFDYKENINAAYFQLGSRWSERFSTEIGLRVENTNTESRYGSASQDSTFSDNYTQLFPTAMAQYRLSDRHEFSMIYGRRIVRPNYRNMNPFIEVRDQFSYEQGNTSLKPELIDNIEVSWLLNKRFSFNAFYTHRSRPISLSFMVEDNRVGSVPLNLSGNHSFGLRAGLNNLKPFTWWTAHINGSLTYKQFDWMVARKTVRDEAVAPTLHISNQFTLPYGWGAEAIGYYSGKMLEGQTTLKPFWTLSLGARKNFLNDKLSLYIYARDIFHSFRPRLVVNSGSLSYTSKEKNDSRMFGISISFRFNKGKEIKKAQNIDRIEESKRIGM